MSVEIDKHHLLPSAEERSSVADGHSDVSAQDTCPKMGVTVVIVPSFMVEIIAPWGTGRSRRNEPIQELVDVADGTGFILGSCEGTR